MAPCMEEVVVVGIMFKRNMKMILQPMFLRFVFLWSLYRCIYVVFLECSRWVSTYTLPLVFSPSEAAIGTCPERSPTRSPTGVGSMDAKVRGRSLSPQKGCSLGIWGLGDQT